MIRRLIILLLIFGCEDTSKITSQKLCDGDYSTANILVDISEEVYNSDESVNAHPDGCL